MPDGQTDDKTRVFLHDNYLEWGGKVDTSVEDGGNQIEYENQLPWIHKLWLGEMDRNGQGSEMGEIFDEGKFRSGG